ncbi:MAG TPA: hypothetical protein VM582_03465 [Candidatus Thermoplasmatota archaeon]|nr:hypothetical protein [Candidatus Thermoplasmatota archaeon]
MDDLEGHLPFVDEHARAIGAGRERTWAALLEVLSRAFGGASAKGFARLVGCDALESSGTFPQDGSAIVGFRPSRVEAPRELALVGRHRFAEYALVFRLDALDGVQRTRLRATTRAAFPGAAGRAYRFAVLGTRGHALAVRRLLSAVANRAER